MKVRSNSIHRAVCSRNRFVSLLRSVLFVLVALPILSIVSISYYSLYCSYRFHLGLIEAKQRLLWNTTEGVRTSFIPILIPLCDRPHYLRRVLDGLVQVAGIEEVGRVGLPLASTSLILCLDARRLLARLCTTSDRVSARLLAVEGSFSYSATYTALLFTAWLRAYP